MINKRILNCLIVGLLLIFGAYIVAGQNAVITVETPVNSSFINGTITVNFNITGAQNISNFTLSVYDTDDNLLFQNFTNVSLPEGGNITNSSVSIPFSNVTFTHGANYSINISTVENTSENGNNINSTILTITLDKIAPNNTIAATGTSAGTTDSSLTSKFDYGSEIKIDCQTNADSGGGINTSINSIALLSPGISTFKNVTTTDNSLEKLKATIKGVDTEKLGKYTIRCIIRDIAGTYNITEINLTATQVVHSGTSAAAIPGFSAPIGKTKISSGTISNGGRLTPTGTSRLIKSGGAIKFDIVGETHKIEVKSASEKSVTLTVSSEPFDVTINAGKSKTIDANGDGISDMEITYHKLFSKTYADLTFKQVSKPVEKVVKDTKEEVPTDFDREEPSESFITPKSGLTVTLAVIVIILIIGYALIKGKKK